MSYGEYNGDTLHDMWVDSTYSAWTGETPYYDSFDKEYSRPCSEVTTRPSKIVRKKMCLNNLHIKAEKLRSLYRKNEERRGARPVISNKALRRLDSRQRGIKAQLASIDEKIADVEYELHKLTAKRNKHLILTAIVFAVLTATLAIFLLIV